jgi:hypothetical protein
MFYEVAAEMPALKRKVLPGDLERQVSHPVIKTNVHAANREILANNLQ